MYWYNGEWVPLPGQFAFQLTGSVATTPLPAALQLFATGLGGLGLLAWCRKRKNATLAA